MWISRPTCSCTAATTAGWQWPRLLTAIPLRKSRYSTPSESSSTQPEPETNSTSIARVGGSEGHVAGLTFVPMPASVNSSSSSECGSRPSMMWA